MNNRLIESVLQAQKKPVDDIPEVIEFDDSDEWVRVYDWLPYGYWRVVTLFREHYNLEVENIWQGYKSNRRPGYQELYRLVDCDTKEVIVPLTCMRKMQQFLAHQGFPQYAPKVKRHKGCVHFMEVLAQLMEGKV